MKWRTRLKLWFMVNFGAKQEPIQGLIMEGKLKRLNERSKVTCRTAKSDYLRLWIAEINNNKKNPSTNWIKICFFIWLHGMKKYQVEFWSIFWNICLYNDLFKGGIYQRRQITKHIKTNLGKVTFSTFGQDRIPKL